MVTRLVVPEPAGRFVDEAAARVLPDDEDLGDWYRAYVQNHRYRFVEDMELARRHTPAGSRVLELGSVPPVMTAALAQAGCDIVGIDIAPQRFSRSISELGLDVRPCNFETEVLPVADASFDAVMMNEVFEHLRIDLVATMGEVLRVLRPGGRLLLSTPNLASYRGYRNLLLRQQAWAANARIHEQYEKLRRLGHMGHVREYTPREVCEFLVECGFEIDDVVFRGRASGWKERATTRASARLLPLFSVIATKPR